MHESGASASSPRKTRALTITRLAGLVARLFPERDIFLRWNGSFRFVSLSRKAQLLVVGALVLASAGFVSLTVIIADFHDRTINRITAATDREIGSVKLAHGVLRDEFVRSEERLRTATRELEAKRTDLLGLLERNTALEQELKAIRSEFATSEAARTRALASREALGRELGRLADKLDEATSRNGVLAGEQRSVESELQREVTERDRLKGRVGQLEQRLAHLQAAQQRVLDRLTERTIDEIDEVKELIARTGLNVETLLAGLFDGTTGQGGPFVAATPAAGGAAEFEATLAVLKSHIDRRDGLAQLLRILPLTPPSDHFYVAGRFGKRKDPINGKWSMHSGIDLAGVAKSPVLSTAPGVVVFVGRHGKYGRMVEIDHGLGIRTRYGHLHRILVSRGRKVGFRQKIGLMGNTGRSTGSHVHYEILVNGKPYDPLKFMQAGNYVFKG